MWLGGSGIVVFLAVWAASGSLFWAGLASAPLWGLLLASVDEPPRDSGAGSSTPVAESPCSCPGLLRIVLVVAGVSWLFGGGDDDGDF